MHIIGNTLEIPFNMWNVMEYSIGFFGGLGMAYGVFGSKWPMERLKPKTWENRSGLFILLLGIPLIVYRESLAYGHLIDRLKEVPHPETIAFYSTVLAALALLGMAVFLFTRLKENEYTPGTVALFLFTYLLVYTLMSYIVKGLLGGQILLNHHLYLLNIALLYLMYKKVDFDPFQKEKDELEVGRWAKWLLVILLILALCTYIAINSHGEMGGGHNRF